MLYATKQSDVALIFKPKIYSTKPNCVLYLIINMKIKMVIKQIENKKCNFLVQKCQNTFHFFCFFAPIDPNIFKQVFEPKNIKNFCQFGNFAI
jgi:hypothetical protein